MSVFLRFSEEKSASAPIIRWREQKCCFLRHLDWRLNCFTIVDVIVTILVDFLSFPFLSHPFLCSFFFSFLSFCSCYPFIFSVRLSLLISYRFPFLFFYSPLTLSCIYFSFPFLSFFPFLFFSIPLLSFINPHQPPGTTPSTPIPLGSPPGKPVPIITIQWGNHSRHVVEICTHLCEGRNKGVKKKKNAMLLSSANQPELNSAGNYDDKWKKTNLCWWF